MNAAMENKNKLIWSKYNHIVESTKYGYFLYNAMSGCLLQVNREDIEFFYHLREHPEDIDLSEDAEFLRKGQIIVDAQTEEDNLTHHINEVLSRRYSPSHMSLTIAVTRACNFNCTYCYELSRPEVYMTEEVEDAIFNFVKQNKSLEKLHVIWYGGEPLLNFKTIERLTRLFKSLDVEYSAQIVTNGYLMTPDISNRFADLSISTVQVTLDGAQETHNKRRPLKGGQPTFDHILTNVRNLLENSGDLELFIRTNVDKSNIDGYPDFYTFLRETFNNDPRVKPYEGYVHNGIEPACSEKNITDPDSRVTYMLKHHTACGEEYAFLPIRRYQTCIATHSYSFLIDPEGDLYKCWMSIQDKKYKVGNVSSEAPFDSVMNARYLVGADYIFSPKCRECTVLPICEGGCPMRRYLNKYEWGKADDCFTFKKQSLRMLEVYYEQMLVAEDGASGT